MNFAKLEIFDLKSLVKLMPWLLFGIQNMCRLCITLQREKHKISFFLLFTSKRSIAVLLFLIVHIQCFFYYCDFVVIFFVCGFVIVQNQHTAFCALMYHTKKAANTNAYDSVSGCILCICSSCIPGL